MSEPEVVDSTVSGEASDQPVSNQPVQNAPADGAVDKSAGDRDAATIELSAKGPDSSSPARTGSGWPGFAELLESFPSAFAHRWDLPSMFNQRWPGTTTGFEPMRVEELVSDGVYVIRAEIPGVDPEHGIDVSVENGRLSIKAERERRTEANEANEFRSEFHYGSYRRSMALPSKAAVDEIKATYDDGILEVRIPLAKATSDQTKITVERTS